MFSLTELLQAELVAIVICRVHSSRFELFSSFRRSSAWKNYISIEDFLPKLVMVLFGLRALQHRTEWHIHSVKMALVA